MQQYLAELDEVKAGASLRGTLTARFLNAITYSIKSLARGDNIHPGAGLMMQKTSHGVLIQCDDSRDVHKKYTHPWKIYTRVSGNTVDVGVEYWSKLSKSLKPKSGQEVIGLLDEKKETGWHKDVYKSSKDVPIYLEVEMNKFGDVVKAKVKVGDEDFDIEKDAWKSKSYVEHAGTSDDDKWHKISRRLIGLLRKETKTIDQRVHGHLTLMYMCIDGYPAKYPVVV